MKTQNVKSTTVNFYEDSYQFDSIKTDLNVTEDFIEFKLAKVYEYRPTSKSLWATIIQNGREIARYSFTYGVFGLTNITKK